jgi:REP element-mobilizing transposase RayT
MPRPPRVFVDGAIYHVYCRVAHGEPVFGDPAEAAALVEVLKEVKRRDEFAVYAWCVMSNHYHLGIRTGRVPLWRTMRLVQGRFAKGYNRRHRVYGPLWQGRYKARVVTSEQHLRQLIAYIHLNPVAAGAVKEPGQYRTSGHAELLGRGTDRDLLDVHEALFPFGDSRVEALRAYLTTLASVARARWAAASIEQLPWSKGTPLEEPTQEGEEVPRLDALGASSEPAPPTMRPDSFVAAAAAILDMPLAELVGPRSGRSLTRAREVLAVVAVERYRLKVKELAEQLGRSPSVVSRWIFEAGRLRASDDEFRETLGRFAAALLAGGAPHSAETTGEVGFISGLGDTFVD